jgi:prevent-host-death family protein
VQEVKMPVLVNMHKAKTDLSRLVARALDGEDVVLTRSGKPVVRLVPIRRERTAGLARGKVRIAEDFDAPLPDDVLECFETA